jgi:hypothetical protein
MASIRSLGSSGSATSSGETRVMIAAVYARKSTDQPGVADDAKSVTRARDGLRRAQGLDRGLGPHDRHSRPVEGNGASTRSRRDASRARPSLVVNRAAGDHRAVSAWRVSRLNALSAGNRLERTLHQVVYPRVTDSGRTRRPTDADSSLREPSAPPSQCASGRSV